MEVKEEDAVFYLENILDKKAFYNPQMRIVRNLNIEIFKNYAKENYKLLDLLSSIGTNSIRIKKSLPFLEVFSNDISKKAVDYLKKNAKINKVKINIFNENAKNLKCVLNEKFEIIDIDPFGTPITFFPYIIDFLKKETLLSLTATDIATLSGKYSEKCLMRYGIYCCETDMERELAIRNLISKTITFFSSFNFSSNVLFSYSEKHFVKIYVLLKKHSKTKIQKELKNCLGFLSFCENCMNKKVGIYEKCEICNKNFFNIGVTYVGKLFDENFIKNAYENSKFKDVKKIFEKAMKDFCEDYTIPPITFNTHLFSKKFKKSPKSIESIVNYFRKQNLSASKSYLDGKSIRINNFKFFIENYEKI